jgi:hypothetical protein
MKNMAIVVPSLFLALGFLLETTAQAGAGTEVKGTIKVAGIVDPGKCDDLEALVSSKKTTGLFRVPVWQRHATAAGSWASGSCTYAVNVVANSEFDVVLGAGDCAFGYYSLTSSPAQAGWFKLSSGGTKDQNFTVDSITCVAVK